MSALIPILIVVLALLALVGCKSDQPTTQPYGPHTLGQWEDTPLRLQQQPVAVVQGSMPLVHIFDVGGPIRVVDLTTGATLLSATVNDRTLVSVDGRNGVTIGSENKLPGPLVEAHQYSIYADPTTSNTIRQGVGVPASLEPR